MMDLGGATAGSAHTPGRDGRGPPFGGRHALDRVPASGRPDSGGRPPERIHPPDCRPGPQGRGGAERVRPARRRVLHRLGRRVPHVRMSEDGQPASPSPRVARYTWGGDCLWSTPIALGAVSHPGVLGMGRIPAGKYALCGPGVPWMKWMSITESAAGLVRRVAASFTDARGGIGRTFFLDLDGGAIVSATAPLPTGRKAIAGPGEFLIGSQGYGEFTTRRSTGTAAKRPGGPAMARSSTAEAPVRGQLEVLAVDVAVPGGPTTPSWMVSVDGATTRPIRRWTRRAQQCSGATAGSSPLTRT
ncbi:hypothetical protein SMICM17S_00193 [Streptomyces microflavus]